MFLKNAVEINNLEFSYGNNQIFNGLCLNIKESSFITITGSNESGKSTLAKILYGLLSFEGQIKINGLELNEKNLDLIRKDIAIASEVPINSYNFETTYENIFYYLKSLKLEKKEIINRINDIKDNLKIDDILDCSFNHLSGAEKQLVSLACILVTEPHILILDNATSMLNEIQKKYVFKYLKKINNNKKMTIINFTNDVEETVFGSSIILLKEGNILINKSTKKALLEEKKFKECNLELPFMASLSLKLKYYGLTDDLILDMNKMVNKLWK